MALVILLIVVNRLTFVFAAPSVGVLVSLSLHLQYGNIEAGVVLDIFSVIPLNNDFFCMRSMYLLQNTPYDP
jgi:hypothetical protein